MKKMISIFFMFLLVFSGFFSIASSNEMGKTLLSKNLSTQSFTMKTSSPLIQHNNDYVQVSFNETTSYLSNIGKPMIPAVSKTLIFPPGTTIETVNVSFESKIMTLDKKIMPSPQPHVLSQYVKQNLLLENRKIDTSIYQSETFYPEKSVQITEKIGLHNSQIVRFVIIDCFTQYAPARDILKIPQDVSIEITYDSTEGNFFTIDEYDLLIITDESFEDELEPLVNHKNNIGTRTVMESVQEIYANYEGRDHAEEIKLRIKDAVEDWGIDFVLLAGGRRGQTFDWYVPSRRTNNDDGWESGYESDLYFADIYKVEDGNIVFEDWDSNENNVFAEWSFDENKKDVIDYIPDVSVGRLPFRKESEIKPVVEKIIDYELHTCDSWFKKGIVVSGDTFPPCRGGAKGYWEGEIVTNQTATILENNGFTVEKLWLSLPDSWSGPKDVISTLNDGAGFIHFTGHSNPASWGTHPPDDTEYIMIDGMRLQDVSKLENTGKYPIVVIGGCHAAQFNVTMMNFIKDIFKYGPIKYFFDDLPRFFLFEWVPQDLSSKFVLQEDAGAIAALGNTGLGYEYINQYVTYGLDGWLEPRFFANYYNESYDITHLGPLHSQAITDYISLIGGVNTDPIDRKTIEEWVLIGDPSLNIGGISS